MSKDKEVPDAVRERALKWWSEIANAQEDMGHYTRINIDPDRFSEMLDDLGECAVLLSAMPEPEWDDKIQAYSRGFADGGTAMREHLAAQQDADQITGFDTTTSREVIEKRLADAAQQNALRKQAHRLAMAAMQSERYNNDVDYREATDNVLAFTLWAKQPTPQQDALRTIREAAQERLSDMEAEFDNPDSDLYDDGALYHDMVALRAALMENGL